MKIYILTFSTPLLTVSSQFLANEQKLTVERKIIENFMEAEPKELFKVFHLIFKKDYELNSEAALKKYRVFKENLQKIKEHNAKKLTWWYSVNEFTDLTDQEFNDYFNIKPHNMEEIKRFYDSQPKFLGQDDSDDINPTQQNVNWVNTLTATRHQGTCGSCWAFATVGAIEGAYFIKHKQTSQYLSPQQFVDCERNSHGCQGGFPYSAVDYAYRNGGVMTEQNYPYRGNQGQCRYNSNQVFTKLTSFQYCFQCNLNFWVNMLAQGPISVLITSQEVLKNYGGGVVNVSQARCAQTDHVIVAYGWTIQNNYQIVSLRNSWGSNWGDHGNFHVYYTPYANSTCWITNQGFRPIL